MQKILILKAGSMLPLSPEFVAEFGDTEHTFLSGCGLTADEADIVDISLGEALPAPGGHAGVIISGSAAMVTEDAPWMLDTSAWLREVVAAGQQVLGVCFGHQLLAHALGGQVGNNPEGLEGGTVEVTFSAADDPLFGTVPARAPMQVHHYQTVLKAPPGSVALAHSAADAHQVLRHAPRAWGVQFHPELTEPMMQSLMEALWPAHVAEGNDPAAMGAGLAQTPEGPALLQRFVTLARA